MLNRHGRVAGKRRERERPLCRFDRDDRRAAPCLLERTVHRGRVGHEQTQRPHPPQSEAHLHLSKSQVSSLKSQCDWKLET